MPSVHFVAPTPHWALSHHTHTLTAYIFTRTYLEIENGIAKDNSVLSNK